MTWYVCYSQRKHTFGLSQFNCSIYSHSPFFLVLRMNNFQCNSSVCMIQNKINGFPNWIEFFGGWKNQRRKKRKLINELDKYRAFAFKWHQCLLNGEAGSCFLSDQFNIEILLCHSVFLWMCLRTYKTVEGRATLIFNVILSPQA